MTAEIDKFNYFQSNFEQPHSNMLNVPSFCKHRAANYTFKHFRCIWPTVLVQRKIVIIILFVCPIILREIVHFRYMYNMAIFIFSQKQSRPNNYTGSCCCIQLSKPSNYLSCWCCLRPNSRNYVLLFLDFSLWTKTK